MPLRQNPHVLKLLSWHGHDSGGVQIPFRRSSPVGQTIETTLIQNLRSLAKSIADGTTEQRWIFLVGGPGNGKSETVQDFLTALDNNLGMQGQLCSLLAEKFRPNPIAPRKVVVESDEVVSAPGNFGDRAGRLVVVQDATATDEAMGNAAKELVKDISSLLNPVESVKPIFVACANRGILARALTEARRQGATMNNVTEFIVKVIRATSIGYDASFIRQDRLSCWPLTSYSQVVCWPLDMESLLTTPVSIRGGTRPSPAEQVFTAAIKESEWEVCADCNSKPLCPFWQNVEWLREPAIRGNYSKVLRHGELYTGQRWNFRDLFSLAAETVIGQWSDFPGKDHPCDWVHERVNQLETSPHRFQRVAPALLLLRRLYPHALFPRVYAQVDLNDTTVNWARHSISEAVFNRAFDIDESSLKPIREILVEDYADLDPAIFTPTSKDEDLHKIEDEYSQSIDLGNDSHFHLQLSLIERKFLELLEAAEAEWEQDLLSRKYLKPLLVVHALRQISCAIVKRSVGARQGDHMEKDLVEEFEASLRDRARLNKIKDTLQEILGGGVITFNMLESYGQPRSEGGSLVTLQSSTAAIRVVLAPSTTPTHPGYDLPFFEISDRYRIPITFDLYSALRLRKQDCSSGSLPASVRAAIDRVRHLYAGELSRNKDNLLDSITSIVIEVIDKRKKIDLDEDEEPILADL